jgi:hypothetical protein
VISVAVVAAASTHIHIVPTSLIRRVCAGNQAKGDGDIKLLLRRPPIIASLLTIVVMFLPAAGVEPAFVRCLKHPFCESIRPWTSRPYSHPGQTLAGALHDRAAIQSLRW